MTAKVHSDDLHESVRNKHFWLADPCHRILQKYVMKFQLLKIPYNITPEKNSLTATWYRILWAIQISGPWTWFKLGWQTGDEGLTFKSMFNTLRFIQICVISYRSRVSILIYLRAFSVPASVESEIMNLQQFLENWRILRKGGFVKGKFLPLKVWLYN